LNGSYINIIDKHRFGYENDYNPQKEMDFIKSSLQSSGFDTNKLRFWITETGTYSGYPAYSIKGIDQPYQSEEQQARSLVKRYVSDLAYGIEKIFWAWNIVEGFQRDCSFFDYTGLVYDGCDCSDGKYTCGNNIGYDLGRGVKKLSYYTYKKMVEMLDNSDWKDIQTIQESDGIYVYKFMKNNKPIWVIWNDNNDSKQVIVVGITSNSVKITEALPKHTTGQQVVDYTNAFNTETKRVVNNEITVNIGNNPVFVEEE
jgi:hypothetical protein